MFTVEERDHVREQLLARAEADEAIVGAAFTGSHAVGESDRWSDTDLVLAVRGELAITLNRWTTWLYDKLGARHSGGTGALCVSGCLLGEKEADPASLNPL